MKFLVLIGGGRAGIDLFQSLLDQHSQVSQFPGVFNLNKFLKKIKNINQPDKIAKIFVQDYSIFFDSRKNKIERHDQLGDKKNSFYKLNEKKFKMIFKKLIGKKELNTKNIVVSLHLAYSTISKENINKKKIIAINLHTEENIVGLGDLNFTTLYTIRDPIVSLSSGFKHWMNYKNGKFVTPWSFFFHIDRQFNSLKKISFKDNSAIVIRLESLHLNSKTTMKKFCRVLKINFENSLLKSTYHNKKWWGDSLSQKFLNGLNKNFKNKVYYDLFFQKDLNLIEFFLSPIYLKYKYNFRFKKNKENYSFLKLYPLKIELLIFLKNIKRLNLLESLKCLYFYLKRVQLMHKYHFKNIKLPKLIN